MLATAAVTAAAALFAPTEVITVGGVNMEPTLREGQRIEFDLGAYAAQPPQAGDIVIFHPPKGAKQNRCATKPVPHRPCAKPHGGADTSVRYISRIVAVGGDRISLRKGRLFRNGHFERRHVTKCVVDGCRLARTITVPHGHVYLLGDNRGSSDDSRFWGAVPVTQVLGRYVRTVGLAQTRP